MKKYKTIKPVLMFIILCLLLWSKPIQAKTIVYAEYFIDTDPGQGLGTPISTCDGFFDEATECLYLNGISSLTLTEGSHTLYVRIKDSDNVWGTIRQLSFNLLEANPYKTLDSAEYFIDNDPGAGESIPLIACDSAFDESIEQAFRNSINTSSLSPGFHSVYVRYKDSFKVWSPARINYIKVCASTANGDVNGDGKVSISDIVYLINYLFKSGPLPCAMRFGDPNNDCNISISDIVYLINYLFKGGPSPQVGCVQGVVCS